MRKFKHKKTNVMGYLEEDRYLHIERSADGGTYVETIWFGFIEDSSDWEEIIEKEYEVLVLKLNSDDIAYIQKDGKYSCTKVINQLKEGHRTLDYMINRLGYKIYSVKRLSDNEIFTVGDIINNNFDKNYKKEILEINNVQLTGYKNAKLWFKTSVGNVALEIAQHRKPLFTTSDGVDIYFGDISYGVRKADFSIIDVVHKGLTYYNPDYFIEFSTKDKAETYVRLNRTNLSYKEVIDCLGQRLNTRDLQRAEKIITELVNSKPLPYT